MIHLAEFFLGLLAVLEAEGRELRENLLILSRRLVFLLFGLALVGAAIVFFMIAVYKALAELISPLLALPIMGLICLVTALFFLWISSGKAAKRKQTVSTHSETNKKMQ